VVKPRPRRRYGGLADRYPISHYQLDYHVDNGVTGLSDPGNTFAQFTASWLFFLAALMMRVVISIFDWSFHVDLITGERGLLSVSNPAAQHYYHDIVMPFLVSARSRSASGSPTRPSSTSTQTSVAR
jgi:hypothetical protein